MSEGQMLNNDSFDWDKQNEEEINRWGNTPVKPFLQSGAEEAATRYAVDMQKRNGGKAMDYFISFMSGTEWQAQQVKPDDTYINVGHIKQPAMQWVKASERLPVDTGARISWRCTNSCNGGLAFNIKHGFDKGESYTKDYKNIEWLEEHK